MTKLASSMNYRVSAIKLKVATWTWVAWWPAVIFEQKFLEKKRLFAASSWPSLPLFFVANAKIFESRLARRAPRGPALSSFCPKQNQHGVHGCHWCGMIVVYLHKRVDEEPYFISNVMTFSLRNAPNLNEATENLLKFCSADDQSASLRVNRQIIFADLQTWKWKVGFKSFHSLDMENVVKMQPA